MKIKSGVHFWVIAFCFVALAACSGGGGGDNASVSDQSKNDANVNLPKGAMNTSDNSDARLAAWAKFIGVEKETKDKAVEEVRTKMPTQFANPVDFKTKEDLAQFADITYRYDVTFRNAVTAISKLNASLSRDYTEISNYKKSYVSAKEVLARADATDDEKRFAYAQQLTFLKSFHGFEQNYIYFVTITKLAQNQLIAGGAKLGFTIYAADLTDVEKKAFGADLIEKTVKEVKDLLAKEDTLNTIRTVDSQIDVNRTGFTASKDSNAYMVPFVLDYAAPLENVTVTAVEGGEKVCFFQFTDSDAGALKAAEMNRRQRSFASEDRGRYVFNTSDLAAINWVYPKDNVFIGSEFTAIEMKRKESVEEYKAQPAKPNDGSWSVPATFKQGTDNNSK
ncbi:MAG: hypothetical protein U1F57_11100 [bacterium]